LNQEGDYFASVVEASPDCIRILDVHGHVEFMNARGQALFEIENFEAYRGRYWPTIWPESARGLVEEAVRAASVGETRSFRAFCPTAKGAMRWWDTIVAPVLGKSGGKPIALLARSRDITEELETRSFLDALVQHVPAILFAKDVRSGKFQLVNQAAEAVFGFRQEEMLGKTDHDLFPKEQADFFRETDLKVIEAGGVTVIDEEQVTNGAGEVRWFRTKKIALHDDQGPRHLVAIAEDVTEAKAAREMLRQALERAEAANQAKSDFLATMSHEVRTPLNGVLGMVQAMAAGELAPGQRERLEVLRRSGESLLAILSDILDLSKIEAGKLELELADFDLEHLVRDSVAAFSSVAAKKGVSLAFTVETSARGAFNGDPTRVRRLIYNLLSNAVKFTDQGRVELTVSYRDEAMFLELADTGIGISPDRLPTLFDKFVQGDASYTRRHGGSGVGLSICRGLAELMGGSITVASTVGEGSIFTARIPLKRVADPQSTTVRPPEAKPDRVEIKVLAAEDNEVNRLVLRTLLQQAGIDPLMVENGEEALQAWESGHWDIVLMDIQMPVMDGISATSAIRARESATGRARTPIVAVTANTMTHQVSEYRAAGIDDVVPKPVDAAALFAALQRALADEADVKAAAQR
jgi:PAS domain S-box-containing protein